MGSITALIITLFLLYGNYASAQLNKQQTLLFTSGKKDAKTEKKKPPKQEENPLDFSDTGRPWAADSR